MRIIAVVPRSHSQKMKGWRHSVRDAPWRLPGAASLPSWLRFCGSGLPGRPHPPPALTNPLLPPHEPSWGPPTHLAPPCSRIVRLSSYSTSLLIRPPATGMTVRQQRCLPLTPEQTNLFRSLTETMTRSWWEMNGFCACGMVALGFRCIIVNMRSGFLAGGWVLEIGTFYALV